MHWAHAVVLLAFSAGLLIFARWGWTHAEGLVPAYFEEDDRWRRIRTVRRGGVACGVAGAVLAVAAVLAVL